MSALNALDGTVVGPVEVDPREPVVLVPIAGTDPERPTMLLLDLEDLDALVEARARLVESYPAALTRTPQGDR